MSKKKREQYNPYTENHSYIKDNLSVKDASSNNQPLPDYDAYYMFTVL